MTKWRTDWTRPAVLGTWRAAPALLLVLCGPAVALAAPGLGESSLDVTLQGVESAATLDMINPAQREELKASAEAAIDAIHESATLALHEVVESFNGLGSVLDASLSGNAPACAEGKGRR